MIRASIIGLWSVIAAGALGCVQQSVYDGALRDLQLARIDAAQSRLREAALRRGLASASPNTGDLVRRLAALEVLNLQLAESLRHAGQSVQQLARDRNELQETLDGAREELAELQSRTGRGANVVATHEARAPRRYPVEIEDPWTGTRTQAMLPPRNTGPFATDTIDPWTR